MKISASYSSNIKNLALARHLVPDRKLDPAQLSHAVKKNYLKLLGTPKPSQLHSALKKFRRQSLSDGVQEPADVAQIFGVVLSKNKIRTEDLERLFGAISSALLASETGIKKSPSSRLLLKAGLGSIPLLAGALAVFYFLKSENQEPENHRQGQKPSPTESLQTAPWDIKAQGNMKVQTELDGDPQLGEVVIVRQAHLPDIEEDSRAPDAIARDPWYLAVGRYQIAILRFLESLRPTHIFVEGNANDLSPKMIHEDPRIRISDLSLERRLQLRTVIRNIPIATLESRPEGLLSVAFARAPLIYALRHDDVWLHKTMRPDETSLEGECWQAIKQFGLQGGVDPDHPEVRKTCFEQRENAAVRELIQFLQANPGVNVVLIYGAGHEFQDDFEKAGFRPRIRSVWWEIPGIPLPSTLTSDAGP